MGYKKSLRNLKDFWKIAEVSEIARRYFAINMFDEILTLIGILVASFFVGVKEPRVVISACVGAAIAMGVSGVWGAYLTEKAEREGKLKILERKLALNLMKTTVGKAHRFAALFLGLVDGLLPVLITPLIIFPFFLSISIVLAYQITLLLLFLFLFLTGMFLGRIGKENLMLAGIRMVLSGIVCVIIIFLIQNFVFKQ